MDAIGPKYVSRKKLIALGAGLLPDEAHFEEDVVPVSDRGVVLAFVTKILLNYCDNNKPHTLSLVSCTFTAEVEVHLNLSLLRFGRY